jgi:glutathione peroxidase
MKSAFIALFIILSTISVTACSSDEKATTQNNTPPDTTQTPAAQSIYDFTVETIDGKKQSLKDYAGKVLVIVNVASECGYTPQYADLQTFFQAHREKGVVVLGFPANNFGGQEPGSNEEIKNFCESKFNVTFPMYAKISVKGGDQAPLYQYLTKTLGVEMKWNFNKFLIDKNGKPVQFFTSGTKVSDEAFSKELKKLL